MRFKKIHPRTIVLNLIRRFFPRFPHALRQDIKDWKQHYLQKRFITWKFGPKTGAAYLDILGIGVELYSNTQNLKRMSSRYFRPNPKTAVFLAFGQSNIANEGASDGQFIARKGVYNFNFMDGRCYEARDPLLGTTGIVGANFLTRFGDMLVAQGTYKRVLLVPVAQGGTYITQWLPGTRFFDRVVAAMDLLARRNIAITHVLFQQGEGEGSQENADGEAWRRSFLAMLEGLRQNGLEAPIYVAQTTRCRCAANSAIRDAQASVVLPEIGILAGPDIDSIDGNGRSDGCHLSALGLQRAAVLWKEKLFGDAV